MFKISTTITDFAPLFLDLEYLFKGLKETGVDGVGLVIGLKSRWSAKGIRKLSDKYDLPITSIHQPIWSGFGIAFDEGFVDIAEELGAQAIVFHPLPRISFEDKRMRAYLQRLARLQEKKKIDMLIENLPSHYKEKIIDSLFPIDKSADIQAMFQAAEEFGLKTTLDIDHLHIPSPHKEPWFDKQLPRIANIHLSSFTQTKTHLPLYTGDFQAKAFLNYLNKKNYQGLLTFEIYYPGLINPFGHNFEAIKKSVEVLKSAE